MKIKTLKPRIQMAKQGIGNSLKQNRISSSTKRGYNYKWQQARVRFLSKNPLCVFCGNTGKITVATVVDHIIPHKGNRDLFWNESNWQPLCKYCHDSLKQRIEKNSY